MSRLTTNIQPAHSSAWVIQTWISFIISVGMMGIGIYQLPVESWIKAFMGMGLSFTVGSTLSLAKTVRDVHEQQRLFARIDEARVSKLISDHDPVDLKGM